MESTIERYMEASGAAPQVKNDFKRLEELVKSKIKYLSPNPKRAAIQVRDAVRSIFKESSKEGSYEMNTFTIQDILTSKSANCLGMPLLVGCLLSEFGFSPKYTVIVSPKDACFELESCFFNRLNDEMPYDLPELAYNQNPLAYYRFLPLEHMLLENSGSFIETTIDGDMITDYESATKLLTFNEALSYVYKDRAATAIKLGNLDECSDIIDKGLTQWEDNKNLHYIRAVLALEKFDDNLFASSFAAIQKLPNENSLHFFNLYRLTGHKGNLHEALKIYPQYAHAIAAKASALVDTDIREAKFQFGIASHLFANSPFLDLPDFYIYNHNELVKLFGDDVIKERLQSFKKEKFGEFCYHLAMYKVTKQVTHLGEALESNGFSEQSPRDKAIFLYYSIGTKYYDKNEIDKLEEEFRSSRLYRKAKGI